MGYVHYVYNPQLVLPDSVQGNRPMVAIRAGEKVFHPEGDEP